jgi:hypothetical protein
VFNTYGLNTCPAAKWAAIDTTAVARANGAIVVVQNGPRYWAMDQIEKYRQGHEVIKNLGGLRMIQEAVLSLASLSTKPYTVHKVNRTTIFVWNKGRRVYELHGPDGSTWVMQAWSQQIDPKLGLKNLPGLGKRLKLPAGWRYITVRLKKTQRVVTVNTDAQVIQDELDNTYSHVASGRGLRTNVQGRGRPDRYMGAMARTNAPAHTSSMTNVPVTGPAAPRECFHDPGREPVT